MKRSIVRVTTAFLVLLSLISLVSCFAQTSRKGSSGSGEGFGKKAPNPRKKKNDDTVNASTPSVASEQRYLEPYGLKLKGSDEASSNSGDDEYRSVRTVTDRSAGDVLLEIPLADTITVDSIRSRLAACESNIEEIIDDEEEALAVGLLRLRDEASDPYVSNVLPKKHYNVWTLPGDLWKETAVILPRCYSETFDATRQRVNTFATQIAEAYNFSVDDVLWAFSMVRSRSLAVPELANNDKMMLAVIPGLDLLNHEFGSGTQLQLYEDSDDTDRSKWVLTSSDFYQAGKEVFLSYGDDKDNWKLLLTYGFALPNNPNAVVFWTWRDLLDAASAVRPDTFSERVCKQLLRHPQLEAYTVMSEQRATFSYDLRSNVPRESLSNGLIMLHSLAAQLGKPESDSEALGSEVLGELLQRRLEELKGGLNRLQSLADEHLEWKPFFESLKTALQAEQEQLELAQTTK